MFDALALKIEKFAELVASLHDDSLLDPEERLEHKTFQSNLERFALSIRRPTGLEDTPANQAKDLFVQIARMSLSRGRRAVFFVQADEIEREASKIPCSLPIYLDRDELLAVAKAAAYYEYAIAVGDDLDEPINRACQKLKSALVKRQTSIAKS